MKTARTMAGLPMLPAIVLLLCLLVVGAVYFVLWPQAPAVGGDTGQYLEVARDLADFHLDAVHDRPVGYPMLLWSTGSIERPTRSLFVVQLVLRLLSIWLLTAVLWKLDVNAKWIAAFVATLILPPFMERSGYALTECLSEFTLVLALAGIVFWRLGASKIWLLTGGIAAGMAALVRPTYEALPLAIFFLLILSALIAPAKNLRQSAVAGLVVAVVGGGLITGYAYYNSKRFGYFGVTPTLGATLSTMTVPFIERLPDRDRAVREELIGARDRSLTKPGSAHTGSQYIFAVRPALARLTGLKPVDLDHLLVRLNLSLISAAPLGYVHQVLQAAGSYWGPGTTGLANFNSRLLQFLWALLHFGIVAVFAVVFSAVAGPTLLRLWANRFARLESATALSMPAEAGTAWILSSGIVAYTMAISCLLNVGDPRHRAPTDSMIVFATFVGIDICRGWTRSMSASPSDQGIEP